MSSRYARIDDQEAAAEGGAQASDVHLPRSARGSGQASPDGAGGLGAGGGLAAGGAGEGAGAGARATFAPPAIQIDRLPRHSIVVPGVADELSSRVEEDNSTRAYINDLLENPESSIAAGMIHYFIIFVILASTGCVILETVPEMSLNPIFFPIEMCITALFTVEFALRLYACDSLRAFSSNCFNVIDFLAIFPGYVDLLILLLRTTETNNHVSKAANSMRTLRMIRIVRLVRVFRVMRLAKVARHSQLLNIIVAVFFKVSQSGLLIVLMLMCFAMVLSASLIYLSESELCEEMGYHCTGPSAFTSIPSAFWWAVATLTTVGYGDMVPHTVMGKVIGGFTAVAGVMVISIGVALVSINFRECFIEEKAKVHNRRRGLNMSLPETRQQESRVLEELLRHFDESSAALLARLQAVVARQDEGGHQQLAAMLDMLTGHRSVLKADIQVFMRHALAYQPESVAAAAAAPAVSFSASPAPAPHGAAAPHGGAVAMAHGDAGAASTPAAAASSTASPAAGTNGGQSPAAWSGM